MGISLLGHIIETVTGQTYEAAIAELILAPLGLERASFFPEEIMTEGFAVGQGLPPGDPAGEPVVLEPWALPRAMNPPGGLIASLHDELRYARFIGDDLATLEGLGLTVFTDFVRDDAGQVAWIRFIGRLVPRAA